MDLEIAQDTTSAMLKSQSSVTDEMQGFKATLEKQQEKSKVLEEKLSEAIDLKTTVEQQLRHVEGKKEQLQENIRLLENKLIGTRENL